ncbi:hypothetical protein BH23VER1_BH23VER1_27750 [soil metagenome]
MLALATKALTRHYRGNDFPAVEAVDLSVSTGEIVALVGESGSGKTTLLRLVAGLEIPDAGSIAIRGRTVCDEHTWLPPEKRGIGLVFQDNALFPHLTVAQNIRFGLSGRGRNSKAGAAKTLDRMLDLVELRGYGERYPHELSGGQRQRIALARALAPEPALLLLDEPFSSLDATLRRHVRDELATILRGAGTTALFVTHDTADAAAVADRIALIHEGKLLQVGTPAEVYENPVDVIAARLFGPVNSLPEGLFQGSPRLVRPEDLMVADAPDGTGICREATVEEVSFAGGFTQLKLRCFAHPPHPLIAFVDRRTKIAVGSTVFLRPRPRPASPPSPG